MPSEVLVGSSNLLAESHTPYLAPVSTAWLLLEKALNCQAALCLLQKHFSVLSTFYALHLYFFQNHSNSLSFLATNYYATASWQTASLRNLKETSYNLHSKVFWNGHKMSVVHAHCFPSDQFTSSILHRQWYRIRSLQNTISADLKCSTYQVQRSSYLCTKNISW
jgi:hypothetical protein